MGQPEPRPDPAPERLPVWRCTRNRDRPPDERPERPSEEQQ